MKKLLPKNYIQGEISVESDKSISHRAIMLGALAEGTTVINNFLFSKDCLKTISCFKNLGIEISTLKDTVIVKGNGLKGLKKPLEVLDVGNSGTTIRLMSGILVGQNFPCEITGDSSILKRPMNRIISPLKEMNAQISSLNNGLAPLKINKTNAIKSINYTMPVASAQVKSAILLASLFAKDKTTIYEPLPSRNHTELMLKEFGVEIELEPNKITLFPPEKLLPREIKIPADISSAAFFIVASLLLKNSHIIIKNVGVNPTRTGIISALKNMGANINILNKKEVSGELVGDIEVKSSSLKGITLKGSIIPKMIDEIPIFVVASLFAKDKTIIKDATELKYKEVNRIEAISQELNKMGAKIKKTNDGMLIEPVKSLKGAILESHNDHRIAMSLAIASLCAKSESILKNSSCVDISFPKFFEILENVIF